ncbi:hypothetical protein Taro_050760, partial [Colocasia esculenta]|nr:hypothetical protein [Colocasia esculenta]
QQELRKQETTLESCKASNTYRWVLLSSGKEQRNATTTDRGRATHTTPAKTSGVGHTAEATLDTPAETTEQPSENDVSLQARPPQSSTRSRAHKMNHPRPRIHRKVGKPYTPVPLRTGTQERNYGTERTPSGNHQNQAKTAVQARATDNVVRKRRHNNSNQATAARSQEGDP